MIIAVCQAQIGPPPLISVQPLDQTVLIGSDATFGVVAVSVTQLSYGWRFNEGSASGSTGKRAYTIHSVKLSDAGAYSVVVKNASGSVTSAPAVLNVIDLNVAPVLPVIGPQTVNALTLLTVTNKATEPNPRSTVSYFLVDPPPGASINTKGIITWTPASDQAPSTNTITTVATSSNLLDPLNPQLSATNAFIVLVLDVPPILSIPAFTGTSLMLTWSSIPGKKYQAQYTPDLSAGTWTDLNSVITATDDTTSTTDILTATNRFYRVVVVP
jgi:hypothetical protein